MVERVLIREKLARQPGGNDAHIFHVLFVVICQESPTHQRRPSHLGIKRKRADDLAGDFSALKADIFADDAHGQNPGNAGNGAEQASRIVVSKAVLYLETAPAARALLAGLFGRLEAANQDVIAAQPLDGLLRFVGRPFADRQHGNDRANAKNDAKHGQRRAQFMQLEAFEAKPDGDEELVRNHRLNAPGPRLRSAPAARPDLFARLSCAQPAEPAPPLCRHA